MVRIIYNDLLSDHTAKITHFISQIITFIEAGCFLTLTTFSRGVQQCQHPGCYLRKKRKKKKKGGAGKRKQKRKRKSHLLAVLVWPTKRLDDEAFTTIQAVGQVLLVTGFEMLRVQRRDRRRRCRTNKETLVSHKNTQKTTKQICVFFTNAFAL